MRAILPALLCSLLAGPAVAQTIVPWTTADKQAVLDVHNALRANVAAGLEPGAAGSLPAASNMNDLLWDEGLASVARDFVAACPAPSGQNLDRGTDLLDLYTAQPDLLRFTPHVFSGSIYLGENAAWTVATAGSGTVQTLFDLWAGEASDYSWGAPPGCSSSTCSHFSQLAWATTRFVGCAMATGCPTSYQTVLVCNYYPAGNFSPSTTPAWETGTPCTTCEPDRTECSDESLCAGCPDPAFPDANFSLPYTPSEPPAFCPDVYPACAEGCDAFDACLGDEEALDVSCNASTDLCTDQTRTSCNGGICLPQTLTCSAPISGSYTAGDTCLDDTAIQALTSMGTGINGVDARVAANDVYVTTGAGVFSLDSATLAQAAGLGMLATGPPIASILHDGSLAVLVTQQAGRISRYAADVGVEDWYRYLQKSSSSDTLSVRPVVHLLSLASPAFQSAYDDDLVVVGSRHSSDTTGNRVYGLNARNGVTEWTFNDAATVQMDVVHGLTLDAPIDRVYVTTERSSASQDSVWAIDVRTGGLVWSQNYGEMRTESVIAGNRVYVAGLYGTLHALNPADGSEIWSRTLGTPITADPMGVALPDGFHLVVADVLLYAMALSLEFGALIALRRRAPELRGAFRIPVGDAGVTVMAAIPMAILVVVVGMEITQPDYGLPAVLGALGTAALGLVAYVAFERRPRGPGRPGPAVASGPPEQGKA